MVKAIIKQAFIIPEGLVDLEITPLPVGIELAFQARCQYNGEEFRFHIYNCPDTGRLEIVPCQFVPYALREIQDELYELIAQRYD